MMRQYEEAKRACGDAMLLFRMGDFYELFHEDAKAASKLLGLTLTSRDKGPNATPMAGFPYHQLDGYLAKLVKCGRRVAVCDQVQDPREAKGLVQREVTRVVTAGTVTDHELLDPRKSNWLLAVAVEKGEGDIGLAWVEPSTGRFEAATVAAGDVPAQLARICPAETLVAESAPPLAAVIAAQTPITQRPDFEFGGKNAAEALTRQFRTQSLAGFGFDERDGPAIRAAGAVLAYLLETQRASLDYLDPPTPFRPSNYLEVDENTRRSLELTRTMRDGVREGSLLSVIDRTVTPMGARLLSDWIDRPLVSVPAISQRHDAIDELLRDTSLTADLREHLKGVYDLQRLLTRVANGRATPRDLAQVTRTLSRLPKIKTKLAGRSSDLIKELETRIELTPDLRSELERGLIEPAPLSAKDGGVIRDGCDATLDEFRDLASGGRRWIAEYQARQVAEAGIPSLKVGYNKVFGYYIEVTNAHRDKIPDHFIRKQTLKNAERYITPELKEHEEKTLAADEKAKAREYELFTQLRERAAGFLPELKRTAAALATLDALAGLADLAARRRYCRPTMTERPILDIADGRHPALDITLPENTFVANDCRMGSGESLAHGPSPSGGGETADASGYIALITGPNMAGKSTYIRQVALITLLAQAGSFVPASKATIGVADRLFARVGASDEIAKGQSTFMVEMTETARILHLATERSLVILDEIGRGTSTYDGLSLAWAIVEYLHEKTQCRTLFATHYHELTDLAKSLPGLANFNVAVREWNDDVVFLHKIVPGAADKSYGIHVARLAGVPGEVNERAKAILSQLEDEHLRGDGRPRIEVAGEAAGTRKKRGQIQLTLFGYEEHPVLDKLRALDVDNLTPMEALQRVTEWREELRRSTD